MRRAVTRLLKLGVTHLRAGRRIEEFMGRDEVQRLSRDERDELAGLLETAAALLELSEAPIPAPVGKEANRARFLGQAVEWREQLKARRGLSWLRLPSSVWRALAAAVLAVAMVLTTGTGVVSAAAASLPGSPLYPVKLAVEGTRLTFTFSPPSRTLLHMRFANERTLEMVRLVATGRNVNEDLVRRMQWHLDGAVHGAEATGGELGLELLERVIENSTRDQEMLREASEGAKPEAQAVLDLGVATAQQSAWEAQESLRRLLMPRGTPIPSPILHGTFVPTGTPSAVPSATPEASDTASATETVEPPSETPEAAAPGDTAAAVASHTPPAGPADTKVPVATATGTPLTATVSATATKPTATHTLEPTPTSVAVFRLTKTDRPDPAPATYRVHYDICIINDGDVPLTNVVIVDRWAGCAYLPPDNPPEVTWVIGTVEAHSQHCVHFALNTYSICGGTTLTNEAVMTCDQGTARVVEQTSIGPTPGPTQAPTFTALPTGTATPVETPTLEPTGEGTATATGTPAVTATAPRTPVVTETPTPLP